MLAWSMSLRCSNCGAPLVLPASPPPFVSCAYCHGTVPVPTHLQPAIAAPAPSPSGSGKLKYAVLAVMLVAGGALIGPLASVLNPAPSVAPGPSPVATAAAASAEARAVATQLPQAPVAPPQRSLEPPRDAPQGAIARQPTLSVTGSGSRSASDKAAVATPPTERESVAAPAADTAPAVTPPRPPKAIHVSIGPASVLVGSYEVAAIQRISGQASGSIRACYAKALEQDPTVAGTLDMRFQIGMDGTTRGVGAMSPSLPSNLVSCVNRAFASLQFPPATPTSVNARTQVRLSAE